MNKATFAYHFSKRRILQLEQKYGVSKTVLLALILWAVL